MKGNNMENSDIYAILDELLELDEGTIKGDETLEDLEWESISIVSFIALVDEEFEIVLSAEKMVECQTVEDLVLLVKKSVS